MMTSIENVAQITELALVEDRLVALADARVGIDDGGLFYGDGVYEVLRLCNGSLFARQEHMDRFVHSLSELGMLDGVDIDWVNARVDQALAATTLSEALLYFQVTRGRPERSLVIPKNWEPHFLLTLRKTPSRLSETIRMVSCPDQRWKRCDIKSLNLLANVLAKQTAQNAGVDDALLVDGHGLITESTSSSVMMVQGNTLWTAPLSANILASVTRKRMLKMAEKFGLRVREESFRVDQALAADELFVVGTTSEVLAIVELDGQSIADGKKGDMALSLHEELRKEMFI